MPIQIIEEEFNPGIKNALYSFFSNYLDAILELTDNAVSNRIPGRIINVEILLPKDKLVIINRGGQGMSIDDLKFFASWGKSKDRNSYDIGRYNQGGKSAMGYLGRSMSVIASPIGEKKQYRIEDNDLHDLTKLKSYNVMEIESDNLEGCVQVEISHLRKKHINKDILSKRLIEVYRPLLEEHILDLRINGEQLRPEPFPLDADFSIDKFEFDVKNNTMSGWVGRLGPRTGIKGGMRCYSQGRLICEKEFFSHHDASYKGTLNYLFGEIYLGEFIPIMPNKTDFDRDSDEWINVKDKMYEILKPHIDELLGREIEEPTEEDIERVKQARNIVACLQKLKDKFDKGPLAEGNDFGQKTPKTRIKVKVSHQPETIRGRYNPATPPPADAIGKRRRTREFMDWDVRPMAEGLRSIIEKKGKGEVLVFNNIFPGYKIAHGNTLYLIETSALQLAKPAVDEKITPEEYINRFDELYSFFCSNLDTARENLKLKNGKTNRN
ncbi:MAG: hypothetical protein ABIJ72_00410 [bacterium]